MRLRISLILFFLFLDLKIYAQDISTAWEYFLKEKYNIADRILNSLLKEGVNSPEIYYLKGLILSRRGDFSQARNYFDKLNFYGVRWSQFSLILRADTFLQEGKFKEARTLYQTFFKRYPESEYTPEVLYKYAHIMRKEGNWEEARTYLRKVVNNYPESLFATLARKLLSEDEFYFCIQLGSFLNYDNAYNLATRIKNMGYPAYIKKVEYRGQLYYRVRVGKYPTKEPAQNTLAELRKKGFHGIIYP